MIRSFVLEFLQILKRFLHFLRRKHKEDNVCVSASLILYKKDNCHIAFSLDYESNN